jgi:hypothetical protein
MDPVTVIVSAIALGAATGLTDTAATAVRDAYAAVKRLVARYPQVDASAVERKPDSAAKRASLVEDLVAAGAASDADLVDAARALIAAVTTHHPLAGHAVGIDLVRVEADALRIRSVASEGTGVRVRDSRFASDIDIDTVRAGLTGFNRP